MPEFNSSAAELTTAATDALLGFLCILLSVGILKSRARNPWRAGLWSWVFGLLAVSSFLGALTHGFDLSSVLRNILWQPLYLTLGIDVALFVLGGVTDWLGEKSARRLVPAAIAAGIVFYCLTVILDGNFLVFVIYEGAAMITAISIYAGLSMRRRLRGASIVASGIALTLIAAALQAGSLEFVLIWPFDHNGIFHLVQMPALLTIGHGLRTLQGSGS